MFKAIFEFLKEIWNWIWDKIVDTKFGYLVLGLIIATSMTVCFYEGKSLKNDYDESMKIYEEYKIGKAEAFEVSRQKDTLVQARVQEKGNREPKVLTSQEIKALITRYFGADAEIAFAIAEAESGLNPQSIHINTNGTKDVGLFQINDIHEKDIMDRVDPENNIALAKKIFDKSNWIPWSVYKNKSYLKFL